MAAADDIFAEVEERKKRLEAELAKAPISDVIAVVDANGPGASQSQGEKLWWMSFDCAAWRLCGGPIQKKPLTMNRKVTNKELEKYHSLIRPYDVIQVKARVVLESVFGTPQARLEDFKGTCSSDAELKEYAEHLQKPVQLKDSLLGTFTLDRRLDWFTTKVKWGGKLITLNLSQSPKAKAALQTAHALWREQASWNRRIRDFAVAELLPLKNESWLDEDEAELSPKQFEKRMTLETITVNPDGSFDFWHNDGDLFWGHSIQVSGSISKGPTDADIPG